MISKKNTSSINWSTASTSSRPYLYTNRHECEIHLTFQNNCYKKYTLENIFIQFQKTFTIFKIIYQYIV